MSCTAHMGLRSPVVLHRRRPRMVGLTCPAEPRRSTWPHCPSP
ncbi:hypothetical protein FM110_07190 [Brachybacterium nesterenkovii]|uniref:Uncharacterized protein n=1 Tax=Brachybacterium nesterenkovii TaxID=47847 RepID=A0A1X6X0M1_9MICO|nr:hypothetical protein FM110_07190 [Brachybacterium nesterenkovii]